MQESESIKYYYIGMFHVYIKAANQINKRYT